MARPRSRSSRRSPLNRLLALVGVGVLAAACTSTVAGTAATSAGTAGAAPSTTSAGSSSSDPNQITVPSGGPSSAGGSTSSSSDPTTTAATSSSVAPETAPAGLQKYYDQHLTWGACTDFATSDSDKQLYADTSLQCARLTVPLAYDAPTGKTITLGVLRKVAADTGSRIGSLVVNPGGPGASGMEYAAQTAASEAKAAAGTSAAAVAELNEKFDLVGFDPRGIGASEPAVHCQTDAQRDAARTQNLRSRNASDVAAANELSKQIIAACLANTGTAEGIDAKTLLANMGTRDVARDMDVLRAALGDPKLTYLGYSYGTEIGWVYAEQFPTKVRAMVFDGVVPPDEDPATLNLDQEKAFEDAFVTFAASCAKTSATCALGQDPSKALAKYQALVRPLLDHPLALPDGRQMSFTDATTGTSAALYFTAYWPYLITGLSRLAAGDGRVLMALADSYYERDSSGHYSNLFDAYNAVRCEDGPRLTSPADITKLNAQVNAAAPYQATGDPAGAIADICAYWPTASTLSPHKLKITGLPKTLVVSTTGDPATPYAGGVDLAQQIGATLLTVQGTHHTSYLSNDLTCVDNIGNAYLENLTLPTANANC